MWLDCIASTGYFNLSPYLSVENLVPNSTTKTIVDGLAAAHQAYGVHSAKILFVAQPNEWNVFDQRWLNLLERYPTHVIRQTFDQLATSAYIDPSTSTLSIITSSMSTTNPSERSEISTIYFRAGYTPVDYPTLAQYTTRFVSEKSRAIKCLSIALQLAGGKKVQQVLTMPGSLEEFLMDGESDSRRFMKEDLDLVRES